MTPGKTLIAVCVAAVLVAGCKKQQDEATAPDADTTPPSSQVEQAPAETTPPPVEATQQQAQAQAAPAKAFDINDIAVSDKPLPAWPFVALPAGYRYYHGDDLAGRTKDLARVPVWTGGQLLWVEGKVFSDQINSGDDKTYSRFEVRKNLQQAVEALGGVRLGERSFDEATYKANEKTLEDFRQEFSSMQNAYWYDKDADTYVIRRADQAIWIVFQSGTDQGALMVAEGPLPEVPAAQ